MRRGAWSALLTLAFILALPGVAAATPPANDNRREAKVIIPLPFADSVEVGDATTEQDEPTAEDGLPTTCGARRSVWYRYDAPSDGTLVASTHGSDFPTAITVYTGSPDSMNPIACESGNVTGSTSVQAVDVFAHRTYFFQVATTDGAVDPGTALGFALRHRPTVTTRVDSSGWIKIAGGNVSITGTAACSAAFDLRIRVQITQEVRGEVHYAGGRRSFACAEALPWQVVVRTDDGFTAGPAEALVEVSAAQESIYQDDVWALDLVRCTRIGTIGDDTLPGTDGDDRLCPLGGDDSVDAGGGHDVVFAGGGADVVRLGSGNDSARGATGRDRLLGGDGSDTLFGGAGTDVCLGGPGRDTLLACER